MGGGDLNMKKSWHPLLIKNQQVVWEKEKAALDEKRRTAQLQKELAEERAVQELRRLQGEPAERKVEWMYATPATGGAVDEEEREAYLLGKKRVDKLFRENQEKAKALEEANRSAAPGSGAGLGYGIANTALDLAAKIREDPLLAIKKQEQAAYEALIKNPKRLKALKEKEDAKKKEKKREKKERKREKRGRDESVDRDGRKRRREESIERERDGKRKRRRDDESIDRYRRRDSDRARDRDYDRDYEGRRGRSRSRSTSTSPRPRAQDRGNDSLSSRPRRRNRSASPSPRRRNYSPSPPPRKRDRSPSPSRRRDRSFTPPRHRDRSPPAQRRRERRDSPSYNSGQPLANDKKYANERSNGNGMQRKDDLLKSAAERPDASERLKAMQSAADSLKTRRKDLVEKAEERDKLEEEAEERRRKEESKSGNGAWERAIMMGGMGARLKDGTLEEKLGSMGMRGRGSREE